MNEEQAEQLIDEVMLGSARGGRKRAEVLECSVVRELTPSDLPLLINPPPVAADRSSTLQIRHSHHMLARIVAEGKELAEVSLLTGYSIAYISDLKNNPAFAELLAYYDMQKDLVFVDVLERMKVLGLNTLDELQQRLETAPDQWTRRELMELAELLLMKGRTGVAAGSGQGPNGQGGVSISVKFVSADKTAAGMIDITPTDGKPV